MKKARKVVALALCAVMLVVGSVAGTLAYLQDQEEVTNTFTVGNVTIFLDEKDTDNTSTFNPGVADDAKEAALEANRDQANKYALMPGSSYEKDPQIHVKTGSQDCYLYVKVTNAIEGIEAEGNTIAAQMTANGWTKINGTDVYKYREVVSGGADVTVFTGFTIDGSVTNDQLAAYATETDNTKGINVVAYAVQTDNFDSAEHAWNETFGK